MTTVRDILKYIDEKAPFDSAMDFDNVGLMVGSEDKEVKTAVVALDATVSVVTEAAEKGAELIITHHPVIFKPLKRLSENSVPYLAAKFGITVISAHTNLDIAPGGVNDTLAGNIGVITQQRFPEDCTLIGILPTTYTSEQLALYLKDKLSLRGLRYTSVNNSIKKVMVACGAGGDSVYSAAALGADALITGEIKHHEILYSYDNGISVFDCGHFQSERVILPVLAAGLCARFPQVSFLQSASEAEVMSYMQDNS